MRALISAIVLLAPSAALAGGYVLPVHGVRPLSKGGAIVATAQGAEAIWYNPANIDQTELHLEAAMISLQSRFTKLEGDDAGKTAENEAAMLPNPTLGFTFRATERFSLAIGAYAPWAGHLKYAEDGPQRYALVRNDESKVLFIHLAGAIRLGENFRIGGGIQNVMANLRHRLVASAYTGVFGWAEDPELDVVTNFDLNDPFTLTANFGATYTAGNFTFAGAVQLPFTISGMAKLEDRLPQSVFFDPVTFNGKEGHIEVPFPLMARAGIAWQAAKWLNLEGAVNFEDWSVQQRINIEPQGASLDGVPLIGTYALGGLTLEKRMRDTVSIHFGAEADAGKGFTLRTGFFYEPSAFADETFSAALPDDDKTAVTFGASYRFSNFRVDAAIARIFQGTREVTASALRQVNPTNPSQAAIVGNGMYETGYWLGGLSFAWIPGSTEGLGRPEDTLDVSLKK